APAPKARPVPGGKKGGKEVDPNARTKNGKTVKQHQDEAAKRGKKPPETGKDITQSKEVKNSIWAELAGKELTDAASASAFIKGIYKKYKDRGLKGMRLVDDPKAPECVGVKVNASVAEVVGDLPVLKKGLKKVLSYVAQFDYLSGTTVLYVYYDIDNKPYGDVIENLENNEHAEMVFKRLH